MFNSPGYELLSNDSETAADYYGALLDWEARGPDPDDPMQYRELRAGENPVAGLLPINDEMREGGARPA